MHGRRLFMRRYSLIWVLINKMMFFIWPYYPVTLNTVPNLEFLCLIVKKKTIVMTFTNVRTSWKDQQERKMKTFNTSRSAWMKYSGVTKTMCSKIMCFNLCDTFSSSKKKSALHWECYLLCGCSGRWGNFECIVWGVQVTYPLIIWHHIYGMLFSYGLYQMN